MQTKIINLFGGPGCGKSTTAAGLFHMMKLKLINCELITEFAKTLTWQGRMNVLANNQAYVHAKQLHYLDSVVGKVEYIITDSPTLLSAVYTPDTYPKAFIPFVVELFNRYDNINFVLNRVKKYDPVGRNQTVSQAIQIDNKVSDFLDENNISYARIDGDEMAVNKIYELVFCR